MDRQLWPLLESPACAQSKGDLQRGHALARPELVMPGACSQGLQTSISSRPLLSPDVEAGRQGVLGCGQLRQQIVTQRARQARPLPLLLVELPQLLDGP